MYIGALDNKTVREWYIYQTECIHSQISTEPPIKERAQRVFELRNQYRHQALMADQELRKRLDREKPMKEWEPAVADKMSR